MGLGNVGAWEVSDPFFEIDNNKRNELREHKIHVERFLDRQPQNLNLAFPPVATNAAVGSEVLLDADSRQVAPTTGTCPISMVRKQMLEVNRCSANLRIFQDQPIRSQPCLGHLLISKTRECAPWLHWPPAHGAPFSSVPFVDLSQTQGQWLKFYVGLPLAPTLTADRQLPF